MIAAALVCGANALVGFRLPELMRDTSAGDFVTIERQIQAFPRRQHVKVLVFGNSHAQAGLRVPKLAAALGLPADRCFSLAFPAQSAEEFAILIRRVLPRFPNVRLAIGGVDPLFFIREDETRLRFLTRADGRDRWTYAMRQSDGEKRLSLLVGWAFPLLDLPGPLWSRVNDDPALMARRLVHDLPPATPAPARLAARPYPWGTPPAWDYFTPTQLAKFKGKQNPLEIQMLAPLMLGNAERRARGLAACREALTRLEARRIRTVLVEVPFEQRMVGVLSRKPYEADYRDYQRMVADLPVMRPAPKGWERTWFLDGNHLSPAGAARLSAWVAARMANQVAAR